MQEPLQIVYNPGAAEAGCDEAGRGCLAGPVFAAAVILPAELDKELASCINDSKKLDHQTRQMLRPEIEKHALAWAVSSLDHEQIDRHNILRASILAMHAALGKLQQEPGFILVDGNYFIPYGKIPHQCIIKGDGQYLSIAAASILAKTYRDSYMQQLHLEYPVYCWDTNKGYPTPQHRKAILEHGLSPYHRRSFNLGLQLRIEI
jgi:ribonuclease HII